MQDGETYPSIAAAEGLAVEDLLEYNGFTAEELNMMGQTVDTALRAGRP